MADIFREIDDELRQEHYLKLWRKYGAYVIAIAVIIVVISAAIVGWREYREARHLGDSERYEAALTLATKGETQNAAALFGAIAADGTDGYASLARLQQAALLAQGGDRAAAIATYEALAGDGGAPEEIRGLAAILAALNRLDDPQGDPAAVAATVAPLAQPGSPWRFSATEVQGIVAQRQGNVARAKELFAQLADDGDAPEGVRARAAEYLTLLGK